jgi:hypothetical protein
MLQITVPAAELWDERNERFIRTRKQTLQLEHSLVSISKWESKWCKPFLSTDKKTTEETIDYIRCMTLTQNVNPNVYVALTNENINQVDDYIGAPMTATTFSNNQGGKKSREIITAELIYYWMIALQIPMKCEKWHINRLLTLIRVCNIKNQPPKKMSQSEIARQYADLNAARRKQLNTKG